MQLLREALDLHLTSVVLQVEELATYLTKHQEIGLIVTDSQAFKEVSAINTKRHPLTSYSILQARQKGDFSYFLQSLEAIAKLPNPAEILMMESCSHNVNHEDIGRIKFLNSYKTLAPPHLKFPLFMGQSFPSR